MMTSKLLMNTTDGSEILHERYKVYPSGKVLSLMYNGSTRIKPVQMDGTTRDDGLNYLYLQSESGGHVIARARLIAEIFVPNPYNLSRINFKDGNRRNCDASNLEWKEKISYTSNARNSIIESRIQNIYLLTREDDILYVSSSLHDVAKHLQCSPTYVTALIKNASPVRRGDVYINKYKKGDEDFDDMRIVLRKYKEERHIG